MVICLRLGARFTSYLTGLPIEEIVKEYPDNIQQYDSKIIDLLANAHHYGGAAGGVIASYVLYWIFYGITDLAILFVGILAWFVGLWFLRSAILAQYFKLTKTEQEVI